jgi:hypothetical protein
VSAVSAPFGIGSAGYPQAVIEHSGKRHRRVMGRT